jgi:hypothetical protein
MQGMFDGTFGIERLAEVSRRNLEEFGRMFTPQQPEGGDDSTAARDQSAARKEKDVGELMRRLSELEERLDALSSGEPSEETK